MDLVELVLGAVACQEGFVARCDFTQRRIPIECEDLLVALGLHCPVAPIVVSVKRYLSFLGSGQWKGADQGARMFRFAPASGTISGTTTGIEGG